MKLPRVWAPVPVSPGEPRLCLSGVPAGAPGPRTACGRTRASALAASWRGFSSLPAGSPSQAAVAARLPGDAVSSWVPPHQEAQARQVGGVADFEWYSSGDREVGHGVLHLVAQHSGRAGGEHLFAGDEDRRGAVELVIPASLVKAQDREERIHEGRSEISACRDVRAEAVPDLRYVAVDEYDLGRVGGDV